MIVSLKQLITISILTVSLQLMAMQEETQTVAQPTPGAESVVGATVIPAPRSESTAVSYRIIPKKIRRVRQPSEPVKYETR